MCASVANAQTPAETGKTEKSTRLAFSGALDYLRGRGDKEGQKASDDTSSAAALAESPAAKAAQEHKVEPNSDSQAEAAQSQSGEAERKTPATDEPVEPEHVTSESEKSDANSPGFLDKLRQYSETLKTLDAESAAKLREILSSGTWAKVPQKSEILKVISEYRAEAVHFLAEYRDRLADSDWVTDS